MTGDTHFDADRDYFAAIAESYDRIQPIIAGPSYRAGLAFLLELVPRESDEAFTFVELGCGTAALTQSLLERFRSANSAAIDSETAMLHIARAQLSPYGDRAEVLQADVLTCDIPACDLVLSSFMFHHVPPDRLSETFSRVAGALTPGGCLILLDTMQVGPRWAERIGAQSRRLYRQHVAAAISAGTVTQAEIDARWAFKQKMKQEGKDVEYRYSAEDILNSMCEAGFDEVGLVWRQFASTIVTGFVPDKRE